MRKKKRSKYSKKTKPRVESTVEFESGEASRCSQFRFRTDVLRDGVSRLGGCGEELGKTSCKNRYKIQQQNTTKMKIIKYIIDVFKRGVDLWILNSGLNVRLAWYFRSNLLKFGINYQKQGKNNVKPDWCFTYIFTNY